MCWVGINGECNTSTRVANSSACIAILQVCQHFFSASVQAISILFLAGPARGPGSTVTNL